MISVSSLLIGLVICLNNPIECIHVLEYGILAVLWYIPLRRTGSSLNPLILATLITFLLGIADEWIQHHLPGRVGDLNDVWLNGASALGALMIAFSLDNKSGGHPLLIPSQTRVAFKMSAISILLLAAFISGTTEKGYRHELINVGVIYSRFTLEEIKALDQKILSDPVGQAGLLDSYPDKMHDPDYRASMDPFHKEALTHLFRRDRHDSRGDPWVALKENQILEQLFPGILKTMGREWSEKKQHSVEKQTRKKTVDIYLSPVSKGDLWVKGYPNLWACTLALAGLLWVSATRISQKSINTQQ